MPSAPATVRERLLEEAALFVVAELPEAVPVLEPLLEGGEHKGSEENPRDVRRCNSGRAVGASCYGCTCSRGCKDGR